MTNRPTLQRKHTRTTEENRNSGLDEGARISLDGQDYEVRAGDLSGLHAARLRREAGYSFNRLLELLAEDSDLDVIATLVWLSRIVRGEDVTLESVLESIGYAQLMDDGFTVEQIQHPEELADDDPEG